MRIVLFYCTDCARAQRSAQQAPSLEFVLTSTGIEYGFGRRAKDLTLENLKAALKVAHIMELLP